MEYYSSATVSGKLCFSSSLLLVCLSLGLLGQLAAAETHYHDFVVEATPVKRLCNTRPTITVNGMFPGPTLQVRNGDSLVINVVNRAKYNVTLHWHGVRQLRTAWADGPSYVTQCPIRPGGSYTYRFTIEEQEGTLWWHAHSSWLRATVYGALVILPKLGSSYPFPKPQQEVPIILGEWWNANPLDVRKQAVRTGSFPRVSDAFTINGQPGDLYPCSSQETVLIPVEPGQTILLRIISAVMNVENFFAIAGHTMTVVGGDASYFRPFTTPYIVITPGQTMDVLVTASQPPSQYYMAARAYQSAPSLPFDRTTTTAILQYKGSERKRPTPLLLPPLPGYTDTGAVTAFIRQVRNPVPVKLPGPVDVELFFTIGLGLFNCPPGKTCLGPNGGRLTASMNNVSFAQPRSLSILQAHLLQAPGVFSPNFPPVPPFPFDYTAANVPRNLWQPARGTEVLKVKYGSVVQLVLQDTSIITPENHPMHLHGHEFYIMATGFGDFNPQRDMARLNLVNPPRRNTLGVPVGGWAVIRFVTDNPGAWLMHCHFDMHLTWGLAMVFVVDNGVGELETLEPPPADLPAC